MTRFNIRSISICAAIACGCAVAWAQGASPMASASVPSKGAAPAAADKTFVNKAALGGMTEVKLGELASSNGQTQAVKDFGKHMVDDHTKANDELGGIAKGKGLEPPAALDAEHQKLVDKFTALKGDTFDKAYWAQMLADHKKTIALFEKEAASGRDADIKSFATKTLPTLRMHLKMVQDAMAAKPSKMS